MKKLIQKTAIITGGGTGIGRAIAVEFANAGANVVIASRNLANLEKVVEEIRALGGHAFAVATDVRVPSQVDNLINRTVKEFERIDILVNNVGKTRRAVLQEMTEEEWDDVLDSNLKSVFLCTQRVAKLMINQKYGKIINMSSVAGRGVNYPGTSNYAAAKAGVIELTKCYAKELGPYGVNVNAIAPGLIPTPTYYIVRTQEEVEQFIQSNLKGTILHRAGTPGEVAKLALFLASDDSSYITGQTITIDGGRTDRM